MTRKRARKDANQDEIVADCRRGGLKVMVIHQLGEGRPDLLVGGNRRLHVSIPGHLYHTTTDIPSLLLVEIKTEDGELTADEQEFFDEWTGLPVIVARKAEDIFIWYGWLPAS